MDRLPSSLLFLLNQKSQTPAVEITANAISVQQNSQPNTNSPGILNIVWRSVDLIEQNHVQLLTSEQTRTMIIHMSVVVLILNDFRKFFPHFVTLTIIFIFRYVSESETGALRKCCVDKTYDPRVLACCQDGILKQHGTCGI